MHHVWERVSQWKGLLDPFLGSWGSLPGHVTTAYWWNCCLRLKALCCCWTGPKIWWKTAVATNW
jgi:hypothetical protein